MKHLLRNLSLTVSLVGGHVADDPILLLLQISRRLPTALVHLLATVSYRLTKRSRASSIAALAAFSLGDTDGMMATFNKAMSTNACGASARHVAEVALAAGKLGVAEELMAKAPGCASDVIPTLARIAWHKGDMSAAVAIAADGGAGLERQRRRLEAELRVFEGRRTSPAPTTYTEPQPQRVLHVLTNSLPHTSSGYAQRSHSILKAQRNSGWEVLAVTRLGYPVQIGKLCAGDLELVDGVPYRRLLPMSLADGLDRRLEQQIDELCRVAERFAPGVLHTTTHFVNAVVTREVARRLGVPWVYEVRGHLADTWAATRPDAARASERYRLFQEREAEMMRDADLVVTLGVSMQKEIAGHGLPLDSIMICPNAVGDHYLEEPQSPSEARVRLGLPDDGPLVGTVSSLVGYEGLDDLISAFALISDSIPELKLMIVGDGVSAPALKVQALRLGLRDRVIFTGRVPREFTASYHQALDVFIVPRKDLPVTRLVTPLKPIEALAMARPVIASDLPALKEIVKHQVNGLLVSPENTDELANAIAKLIGDERMRTMYGLNGRKAVLADRTWSRNAERYGTAYERLQTANR